MSTRAKLGPVVTPLLALFTLILVGLTAGHETRPWRQVPQPAFQAGVALTRQVLDNPLSGLEGDQILVTAYEEWPARLRTSSESGTFLNIYLVSGLVVSPEEPEGILHDTDLIVVQWVYNPRSATRTALQWTFSVKDPDYALKNGMFQKTVLDIAGNVLSQEGVLIPAEGLHEMQPYFEETIDRMADKAREESCAHLITG